MAAEMHALTLAVIGQILFGVDLAPHAAEVRHALTVASASIDPLFSLLAPARRLRPARDSLHALLDRAAQRLASADDGGDVLSLLKRAEGSGGQAVTDASFPIR